jgi:hypothetical protein
MSNITNMDARMHKNTTSLPVHDETYSNKKHKPKNEQHERASTESKWLQKTIQNMSQYIVHRDTIKVEDLMRSKNRRVYCPQI